MFWMYVSTSGARSRTTLITLILAAPAAVNRTLVGQAYLLATDDIFWLSGWVCILLVGMVWLCRRAVSGGGPVAAD